MLQLTNVITPTISSNGLYVYALNTIALAISSWPLIFSREQLSSFFHVDEKDLPLCWLTLSLTHDANTGDPAPVLESI